MNIDARKISFIQEYLRIENEKILNEVEKFFYKTRLEAFEDDLKPMSLEKFNDEIDQALEDEKKGNLTNIKDLKKNIQKWS